MRNHSAFAIALGVLTACGGDGGSTSDDDDDGTAASVDDGSSNATEGGPSSVDDTASSVDDDGTASDAETGSSDSTGGGEIPSLSVGFELATPEQIAIHAPVVADIPQDARVTVRWRTADGGEWQAAHPLLRIHPEWTNGEAPQAPSMRSPARSSISSPAPSTTSSSRSRCPAKTTRA